MIRVDRGGTRPRRTAYLVFLREAASGRCLGLFGAKKRPIGVQDGAVIYISRLTKGPNDIRVFGRAIWIAARAGR